MIRLPANAIALFIELPAPYIGRMRPVQEKASGGKSKRAAQAKDVMRVPLMPQSSAAVKKAKR
jgi:hypothetical protein